MLTVNKKLWFGATAFALALAGVLPGSVSAATVKCPDYSGKVVKVKTDYWLVQNGQRWHLVDRDAAGTWDKAIVTPNTACAATVTALPDGGAQLGFRAGTRLIKVAGSGSVYALGPNGVLHPIPSPAVAAQWYGRYWSTAVRTISAETFAKYTVGEALSLDKINDGAVVRLSGKAQLYLVRDGKLVKITGPIRAAISSNARTLTAAVFKKLTLSTETVTGAEVLKINTPSGQAPATTGTTEVKVETKVETKVDTKTETKVETKVETDLTKMPVSASANYKGPFPAPEGLVLTGTIGEEKYFEPTGNGAFRFRPQTGSGMSINCLDKTRTVLNSKGANYDSGFKFGVEYGVTDGNMLWPLYNDTPRGNGNVGNEYFNEGFRVGYRRGFEVGDAYGMYYDCRTSAYVPGDYDTDGWRKTANFAKAPNLKAVYYPSQNAGYGGQAAKSSPEGYTWSIGKIEETELNKDKVVNLSRIEVVEATPDAAEANMTMEAVAKMAYDGAVQYTATKYNRICTLTQPTIETKTYGSNTYALLTFVQICKPEANKDATWKLQAYAYMKGKTSGHVLSVMFVDPNDLKKSGANEIDAAKLPSTPFIEQFLSKIQFN